MQVGLNALLAQLEEDPSLCEPLRLQQRGDAVERLDSCLAFTTATQDAAERAAVARARALQAKFEAIDAVFCAGIRQKIQCGGRPDWLLDQVRVCAQGDSSIEERFDQLDAVVAGILQLEQPGVPSQPAHAELIPYQPTPARHIFDFIGRASPGAGDVVFDLGSGLGHVPLLTTICTDARCVGIEREPAYVATAERCASQLNLRNVSFVAQDVRSADLSTGTLFYLYTPFTGSVLRHVLDGLRALARDRVIRLGTYGPCTPIVAQEPWLDVETTYDVSRPVLLRSRA